MENICSANNYKLIEFVNIIDGILMCFSFIYVTNDLREDAYICPIYAMKRTTESAIYVMELWLWDDFKWLFNIQSVHLLKWKLSISPLR